MAGDGMDAVKTSIKLADLMAYKGEMPVEVVNGTLEEMPLMGGLHHLIAGNIHYLLTTALNHYVFTFGLLYLLDFEEARVYRARIPDVSYVNILPPDLELPFPGAPTLAVEVMSPNDDPDEMLAKVREYLNAGSEQVWVVYPRQKEVHLYRRGESQVQTYRGEAMLDAGDLMAGLVLKVSDFFRLPDRDA